MINQILAKCDVSPQEAVYVGDMTIDVQTGNNAGVKTVSVVTGSSTKEEIAEHNPFRIIPNIKELLEILQELG